MYTHVHMLAYTHTLINTETQLAHYAYYYSFVCCMADHMVFLSLSLFLPFLYFLEWEWGLLGFSPPPLLGLLLWSLFISCSVQFRQSCWRDFMGIDSDITKRHKIIANSLIHWLLHYFCPYNYFWALEVGVVFQWYLLGLDSTILYLIGCGFL